MGVRVTFNGEPMERRAGPRCRLTCPLILAVEGVVREGRLRDLSVTGCAMDLKQTLGAPDSLTLALLLPDEGPTVSVLLGTVRWTGAKTCGVEFLQIEPDQHRRLAGYLETVVSPARLSQMPHRVAPLPHAGVL